MIGPSPCFAAPRLLSLFLFSLSVSAGQLGAAEAEDRVGGTGGSSWSSAPRAINSATVALGSNSTAQDPAVSVSLALSLSQDLNPNPYINPHPTMSVSLSLSVSEEIKANPFDFISLPQQRPDQGLHPHEEPREAERLKEGVSLQEEAKRGSARVGAGKCSYTVVIKTSCSSPRVTRDAVSLAFGDAYHNEVYAARMDDPASGTFERCSVDTFRVVGPCGGRTCYLYLRRYGRDGWTPEYVKVLYRPGDSGASVTFFYGSPLPNGVWYGFDLCEKSAARGSTITALPAAATAAIAAIGAMTLAGSGGGGGDVAARGEIPWN